MAKICLQQLDWWVLQIPWKNFEIARCYGPETQKSSEMCPISALVKIFSFWHYIPIDNPWIDHSYQFWPPNPYTRCAVAHERQVICSRFMRKLLIAKLLKRCLLVATGVPYKSQLTLDPCCHPSCRKWMICVLAPKGPLTQAALTRTAVNMEFFKIFAKPSQIDWHLHANLWVKIPNIHRCRILGLFRNVKNSLKVGTSSLSKWPIGDVFKNPTQGI